MNLINRYLLILAGSVLASSFIEAAKLTPGQALLRALDGGQRQCQSLSTDNSYKLEWTSANENVYCFNNPRGGFVIAAGDDAMGASLLGFSDSGSIDAENMPSALKDMLEAFSTGVFESSKAPASFDSIEPLLSSQWAQDAPFNNDCPVSSDGYRAVCGCAATAISQVLNHFKYPECGTGIGTGSLGDRELTLDLSTRPIDWPNILDDYSGSFSDAQAAAVANLVYVVGMSINMEYSPVSSGASINDCVLGVTQHLGFDKAMRSLRRDFYTVDEWNAMVYAELATNRPVVYFGFNPYGGHAFVIDGYEGGDSGYFHVNWGWAGLSDGYFLLTNLSPSDQGIGGSAEGYNKNQEAFFDMLPDNGTESYRPVIGLYGSFGVKSASILKSKNPVFCATAPGVNNYEGFYNVGLFSFTGNLGIRCVNNATGDETLISSSVVSTIPVQGRVQTFEIDASDMPGEGEYTVTPVIEYDGEWYDVSQDSSVRKVLTLTVTDKRFKFKSSDFPQSGIDFVIDRQDVSSGEMEIYDLSGVRVVNPVSGGIYIIRCNGKVSKIRL